MDAKVPEAISEAVTGNMDTEDNPSEESYDKNLLFCTQEEKESLQPCFVQEVDKELPQSSNDLPCCSKKGFGIDFNHQIYLDSQGLFIPWELYNCIGYGLLRPLAKLQALQNMNLYRAIQIELRRRGRNGGLEMLNIARELAVPGYFREIRALWDSYGNAAENFDFVFMRILSFLHWANANIYLLTDLGLLNVEMLMLCYNCRWGETSIARKRFDTFMRQILFEMKDLLALRSWCGILREKTVVDVAMVRAEYLTILDLGTMVPKGPFKKWNLKELFRKLKNLEDFTWLNCDIRTLVYLASAASLKRLVLHITKYDQVFFEQFFAQFGSDINEHERKPEANEKLKWGFFPLSRQGSIRDNCSGSNIFSDIQETSSPAAYPSQSGSSHLNQKEEAMGQTWISPKPSTKKVHLNYVALSFACGIFQSEGHGSRSCFSRNLEFQIPVQLLEPRGFHIPSAVFEADTVILNLPPTFYHRNLLNLGVSKTKFSIGFPKEICANIKPNRISYGSVVQTLENVLYNRNRGETVWFILTYNYDLMEFALQIVKEAEIHVMIDYYREERVVNLFNLAMESFSPKILRLSFTAAGRSVKGYYRWPRSLTDDELFLRYLTVFDLTLNCLTFHVPKMVSCFSAPNLEEVYITLCGVPHDENGTVQNVVEFFQFFFDFFETLAKTAAEVAADCKPVRLEVLGVVCCVPKMKAEEVLSSRICNAIEGVHPVVRKHLKKVILDGRVWGALSAEHFAYVQDLLLDCTFEAELAPDDCKDLKYRRIYESDTIRSGATDDIRNVNGSESDGSESPTLDGGDEYLLRSDYSDTTEEEESRTFAEIFASKIRKKGISAKKDGFISPSQSSSKEEVDSNNVEHSSRKKGRYKLPVKEYSIRSCGKPPSKKISLRKQNSVNESLTLSDEEWFPGIRGSKRRK
uniref:Uncharacterized protein n=1 Tax=Setaria digitata TaxID=48799 RepID=A0A915PWB6_9BILA